MKRLIASVFLIVMTVCLCACSVPGNIQSTQKRPNELGSAFQSHISISLDRLNSEATIKRFGDGEWEVEFDSPNTLSGVMLTFSEGNVTASYKGLSFSVPKSALPVKAMLLNLIEAVDTSARLDELSGTENEGLLVMSGSLDGGEYTLSVDGDGHAAAFEMPNNLLKIVFTELTVMESVTTPAPEETTTSGDEPQEAAETETVPAE